MAYLHGSDERQQAIADALSSRAAAELKPAWPGAIGHAAGTTAGEGVMNVAGQLGYVCRELRF